MSAKNTKKKSRPHVKHDAKYDAKPKIKFLGLSPRELTVFMIPILCALWVWFSALAFVPVPWPDDSAFYFVAKELFHWPPRWVMLPQAPFEPTYRIFNFNTMPLFPILIGLGKFIGIDGSFLLKVWPLSAWALTGSAVSVVLYRKGLPLILSILLALIFGLDPIHRWASVLVRPESLIGLFAVLILLGLTFGYPKRLEERGWWNPTSALLALGAYTHFNAIHLVFPVVIALLTQPKRLIKTGLLSALYLVPWMFTVVTHLKIFQQQMEVQWQRVSVPNGWLNSLSSAAQSAFQSLGSPEAWPNELFWAGYALWFLIFAGIIYVGILLYSEASGKSLSAISGAKPESVPSANALAASLTWVFSSIWIYHTKPEVWFIYYLHIATWTFMGLLLLKLFSTRPMKIFDRSFSTLLVGGVSFCFFVFQWVDTSQAQRLGDTASWNWSTYDDYVACVDEQLTQLEKDLGSPHPFRVWCPTFPDITIELSRKHPEWEMTRVNDFMDRIPLALQHGWDTEAVVVTEMLNWQERTVSRVPAAVPEIKSVWMNWKDYYLHQFADAPGWKPNRFVCQRGRWQAFLFMKDVPGTSKPSN